MSQDDDLVDIRVELPHRRTANLGHLIEGWRKQVERLHDQAESASAEAPDVWGADDYIGALHLRSLIDIALAQVSSSARRAAEAKLALTEERLTSFTELDASGVVEQFSGESFAASEWWWRRLPKRGPVREEMLETVGRLGPGLDHS